MSNLLIAASGTGGHIFPALAVAQQVPNTWALKWLGVSNRLESQLIAEKYELITIKAEGLNGNYLQKVIQIFRLILATSTVYQQIRKNKIKVVFTTGGYIAAPTILGARCCGVPVILHESNAIPGKVTRLLGRFCKVVALGLSTNVKYLQNCKTIVTGTPVRKSFLVSQPLPNWVPSGEGPLLVVMGGSQGAIGLNQMVRAILPKLLDAGCRVVHLTGTNDPESNRIIHPNLIEIPFCDEIPGLLQHADLAISRAGAGALSELAICGTPTILIPYPQATDKHQEANANCAAQIGAAIIIHQHEPRHRALADTTWRLLEGRIKKIKIINDPLTQMHKAMKTLAVFNADQQLINVINQFIVD